MKYTIDVKEQPIQLADREIYGRLYVPCKKNGALPCVILSHGYNSCCGDLEDMARSLAECGVLAYSYDFCGGSVRSQSSGRSVDMSISSEMDDLNKVIEFIMGLEKTDNDRIYLYGESQGGFVSALTADERIAGMYLLYPAFCIPDNWRGRTIEGTMMFMGLELSDKFCKGLPQSDVFEHIGRYMGRVRLYQGTADTLVTPDYAKRAAKCFTDCTLTEFPGEGHGFSAAARKRLIEAVTEDITVG